MKNQKGYIGVIVAALIAVFIIGLIFFNFYYVKGTERKETFTVNKLERVQSGDVSKYLVFTDTGVYENTDSLLNGKFNSSDLYNQLEEDSKYTCTVYGWRIGFFSQYPNLVSCDEVQN